MIGYDPSLLLEEERFRPFLAPGEHILWYGQPVAARLLGVVDVVLIPFSIMWLGFAVFWETMAIGMATTRSEPATLIFPFVGAFFVLIGLYLVVGRFVVKYVRRRRTRYALTDRRVLVLTDLFGSRLEAADLARLPGVALGMSWGGTGTISFTGMLDGPHVGGDLGEPHARRGRARRTGLRFEAIRDAVTVYGLIEAQRREIGGRAEG